MTILELLNRSTHYLRDRRIKNPRLNAELLLAHSLNVSREGLYIHLREQVREKETLERMIERRVRGEPLQYILEHQEFWSFDFKVDPRVLIPRPESELLVDQALSILSKDSFETGRFILELGTGSGVIAISIAKELKGVFLVATDISRDALVLAMENAKSVGVLHHIEFVNGDLFTPFHCFRGRKPFDLVLANPPYINRSEIQRLPKEVRDYEPIIALDGGEDGLGFYRRITSQAPFYLQEKGWLLLEVGQGQGSKVSDMIEKGGCFNVPELVKDFSGVERVVKAQIK
jgi:release factor glutamine methyltransferase